MDGATKVAVQCVEVGHRSWIRADCCDNIPRVESRRLLQSCLGL